MAITKKDLQDALRDQSKDLKVYVDRRLDDRLGERTKELKGYVKEQIDGLAGIVKAGFDDVDRQFAEMRSQLDVREQVAEHERKIRKIAKALHVQL